MSLDPRVSGLILVCVCLIDEGVSKCLCGSLPFSPFSARHFIRITKRGLSGLRCRVLLKAMFEALVVAEMLCVKGKVKCSKQVKYRLIT